MPGYSPDLNAIETVWLVFKTRLSERAPETLEELKRIAVQEWANFSVEDIRVHIQSMPNRLAEVIRKR